MTACDPCVKVREIVLRLLRRTVEKVDRDVRVDRSLSGGTTTE
jgi:hypothetical protein